MSEITNKIDWVAAFDKLRHRWGMPVTQFVEGAGFFYHANFVTAILRERLAD